MKTIIKIKTYLRLGIDNIITVLIHRIKKYFFFKKLKFKLELSDKVFKEVKYKNFIGSNNNHTNNSVLFSWKEINFENYPIWQKNYLTGFIHKPSNLYFERIDDFIEGFGDIKGVWELSRFEWVLTLAINSSDDKKYLSKLNAWLIDWNKNNPPFLGLNWKCGQEASIRLINLCLASIFLAVSERDFCNLLKMHIKRIEATHSYALAQNNNHAISESAALYIGYSYLKDNENKKKYFNEINNLIKKLFLEDGTFAQYSINYQRMAINTINIVELWRLKNDLELNFSTLAKQRISKAVDWIEIFISGKSGEVPNFGHNDGSNIFAFHKDSFRDYRYVLELSSILFRNEKISTNINFPDMLIENSNISKTTRDQEDFYNFKNSGVIVSKKADSKIFFKYPVFKFRPAQCDSLNIDIWLHGKNIIRDAGTFSYNFNNMKLDYYSGDRGHNVVQIGEGNEMPRISRFLFGNWSKTKEIQIMNDEVSNRFKVKILKNKSFWSREIKHVNKIIEISDSISPSLNLKVFRLRLINEKYEILSNKIIFKDFKIEFFSNLRDSLPITILKETESLHYYEESNINLLEIKLLDSENIRTIINY